MLQFELHMILYMIYRFMDDTITYIVTVCNGVGGPGLDGEGR